MPLSCILELGTVVECCLPNLMKSESMSSVGQVIYCRLRKTECQDLEFGEHGIGKGSYEPKLLGLSRIQGNRGRMTMMTPGFSLKDCNVGGEES